MNCDFNVFINTDKDKIELLCKDEKFSEAKFLGVEENLLDVCNTDKAYLDSIGISNKEIAKFLIACINKVLQPQNKIYTAHGDTYVNDTYALYVTEWMGSQKCPFSDTYIDGYGDTDYILYNKIKQKSIKFGSLHIHLIQEHCFFEGKGGYRLNPEDLVEVLGITSESAEISESAQTSEYVETSECVKFSRLEIDMSRINTSDYINDTSSFKLNRPQIDFLDMQRNLLITLSGMHGLKYE
jgi:hypothetical protein